MPRTVIKRDPKGNPFYEVDEKGKPIMKGGKPVLRDAKQGEKVVAIQVTYATGIDVEDHADAIWKAAVTGDLHQSTKVTGVGNLTPQGYIHCYSGNVCLLVTRLGKGKTIEIAKQGKVNGGVHKF